MHTKKLKLCAALFCAAFTLASTVLAQSSRPGWGSTPYHDTSGTGVTFRVWAPNATSVYVPGTFNGWSTTATPLVEEQTNGAVDGIWSADVAGVTNLSQYKYYINNPYVSNNWKHDPRSRWVTNPGTAAGANDIVYDPTAFNWNGDNFTNPALNDLFVYEMHIGTFPSSSSPSRFIAATNKLDYLKSLGINAIEVMPVAEFGNANSSEGYDPAQPFAVDNVQYGGPDAFKTFVIACHARGLAVLLDVVHNHYGTGDLDMWDFDGFAGTNSQGGGGIYFFQTNVNLQITPYGATRPNFNSQQVDNYVSNNIVMWLSEYHVDGFRWDDPYTLTHDNAGNYIPNAGNLLNGINNMTHANYPGKISIAEDVIDTWGFDSSWDTGYPSYFTPVLTNTVDANRNMNLVTYAIQNDISYSGFAAGFGRVVYLESHDVVYGPNGGERLVTAIASNAPTSYRARKLSTLGATVTLTAPGVPMIYQGQEMLESNAFYSYTPLDWTKTNTYSGIVQLYRDLITARRDLKGYTPGLEGDQCSVLWSDNTSKLVAFHRWKSGTTNQDAVVIANFANVNYNNGYNLNFPYAGTWYVHFNTDSTNYSSDFGNNGSTVVTASGNPPMASVVIGPYSALILSPTPDAPPQLTITPMNGTVNVSWPNTYSEWLLDSSTTLAGNPPPWTQVSTSQYQTNATAIFINTNSSSGATFYRLRKP
ncbi:MAG: alpha-amylase family glycosyl hydrolase [Verrucomicrobiia bacterium]